MGALVVGSELTIASALLPIIWWGEKNPKVKSIKLPNLFIAVVQCASRLQHLSQLAMIPRFVGSTRVGGGLQGLRNEASNTQRFFKGLWRSSTFTCRVVGLHSESLGVERMRRWEERVLWLFAFRSA